MQDRPPSPEKVFQYSMLARLGSAVLGTAVTAGLFGHLEKGPSTVEKLASAAGLSVRGTQALLDGLVAIGFCSVSGGQYANTPEASVYLVEGKPTYLGFFPKMSLGPGPEAGGLLEVVRSGAPGEHVHTADEKENPFWEELVLGIAPLAAPVAQMACERTGFAGLEAPSLLDVGGGSGIYSVVFLKANAGARATQVDWANVNGIARGYVGKAGVGDRFRTVDGDFHTVDYGQGHDVAIFSNIAHQETPADNVALYRRLKAALKPGGTLVVSDFVLDDNRTSPHPWVGLFHVNMLQMTRGGAVWTESDYRRWLTEAGFQSVEVQPTPTPSTLIYAR